MKEKLFVSSLIALKNGKFQRKIKKMCLWSESLPPDSLLPFPPVIAKDNGFILATSLAAKQ